MKHTLLFSGTINWERLAGIIAGSAYKKCAGLEVSMRNSGVEDEIEFLGLAFETGVQFSKMMEDAKKKEKANGSFKY